MIAAALALALLPTTSADRVEAIWAVADARVARQVDAWFKLGDFPRVEQLLREQWAYSPHDYEVATNLGWMLENMQEDDAAIAVYGEYRVRNPRDLDGRLPEAMLHAARRHPEKVIETLEPLLAALDENGRRKGEPKDSPGSLPHPNVFRLLAKAYERTNQPEKAIATWELQLRAYPGDLPAEANIRRVRAKMKGTETPKTPPPASPGSGSSGSGSSKPSAPQRAPAKPR